MVGVLLARALLVRALLVRALLVRALLVRALRAAPPRRATALARRQMGDSERHARGRARPSNPPRTPRRRRASLRHETKKPPEGVMPFS
jgi:hypothetical protein